MSFPSPQLLLLPRGLHFRQRRVRVQRLGVLGSVGAHRRGDSGHRHSPHAARVPERTPQEETGHGAHVRHRLDGRKVPGWSAAPAAAERLLRATAAVQRPADARTIHGLDLQPQRRLLRRPDPGRAAATKRLRPAAPRRARRRRRRRPAACGTAFRKVKKGVVRHGAWPAGDESTASASLECDGGSDWQRLNTTPLCVPAGC